MVVRMTKMLLMRIHRVLRWINHIFFDEIPFRVQGVPPEDKTCIEKYFVSHNAARYLQRFTNQNVRRIIMQVGMDKTGSSSVQGFLYRNGDYLRQYSCEYKSDWGRMNHSLPIKSLVSYNPSRIYQHRARNRSKQQVAQYNYNNLMSLCSGIQGCSQSTYILYGEGICSLNKSEHRLLIQLLQILIPNAQMEILFCVRSHVGYASSAYQQTLKMGRYFTDQKKVIQYSNLYKKRIAKLIDVYTHDKLTIYRFEDAVQHSLGPVGYFLELIGIPSDGLSVQQIRQMNQSISYQAAEIIEYINCKQPMMIGTKRNPLRLARDTHPFKAISGPKYRIPEIVSKRIQQVAEDDILWIKEQFGIEYPLTISAEAQRIIDYDIVYRDQCIQAYNQVNASIRLLFYQFIMYKIQTCTNERHKAIFQELEACMRNGSTIAQK